MNTVYLIAVMSSLNCGVDVLCFRAVEPDLRCYTQDDCIASLNRLMAEAAAGSFFDLPVEVRPLMPWSGGAKTCHFRTFPAAATVALGKIS
jgi:hypothetical protein